MDIRQFQDLIRRRYYTTDSARGPAATFLWFSEEFGELARAIACHLRGDGDRVSLEEEFADVLAWLATLANVTDVDLEVAVTRKYVEGGGPPGTK
jgi:NTP pyrophosphatase (non-canonical NTP hydrolase)